MAAKITVKNNGSIHVEGEFELFDIDGNKFDLAGVQQSLCADAAKVRTNHFVMVPTARVIFNQKLKHTNYRQ